ncbi:MAG: hypothetical protein KF745_14555 [Phycisphaeraceae bacterium]|nr:hypothetical protein [Phycisphaeraceae bacterium]
MSSRSRALTLALLTCAAAVSGGCYWPGGPGYSADRFTYESTSFQPQTVSVIDTRTDQTIWTVDIPVGKELVVWFRADLGTKDSSTPDRMDWAVFPAGQTSGSLPNNLPVPPASSRRIDTFVRPVPELPEDMTSPPTRQPVINLPGTGQ